MFSHRLFWCLRQNHENRYYTNHSTDCRANRNCSTDCGTNRNHSTDSRFLEVGQIEEDRVIGKVLFRIWPLNKIGGIS